MPNQINDRVSTQMRIYLFGRFRIHQGSKVIQLPTRKSEALLAYLLMNPNGHAREKLAALFWGDSSQTEARNSLRNALAVLNNKLGHDLLIADRQMVALNPENPLWVDAQVFEAQASRFLSSPSPRPGQVDIALYQEDLLADFYDDWILPMRQYYRTLFLRTLLAITQQLRSNSEYEDAIAIARKILSFDSSNERAHQHLMFFYTALGDRSAALRQYEECQKTMLEELGVEPAAETIRLYEWIKQTPAETNPLEARITNLPIPLTNFIGRRLEMNEIKLMISSTRLLTLTGPGGSGKTRLAVQIGTELLETYKDGVWWVDLASLLDKTLVNHAIAKSLGVPEVANEPLNETLYRYLKSKQLLLILDNCEHLIDSCAHIVNFLVERCDHLTILATSRESLNLTGESIYYVPTMSLPEPQQPSTMDILIGFEGIRLFVERARSVRSDFMLTEQNAAYVSQICQRLDGIPLAIELAAARVKLLTAEQIAARLDDRFQLLTGGSRMVLPRHQTLRAVMEWSSALLSEKERMLFRLLAVFSGSWGLEATEAVCSFDGRLVKGEILNLLSNLVDKSLVIREGDLDGKTRYRMLETIRQFAQDELEKAGQTNEIQKHHLDYYLRLVETVKPHLGFFLTDSEMLSWLPVFALEKDNLRAALNFCETNLSFVEAGLKMAGSLHWYYFVHNSLSEGREWIDRVLKKTGVISQAVMAQAYLTTGFLACWQGDFVSARASLERSLTLFEAIDERSGVAFSLHGLGFAANGLGEHSQAGRMFTECLRIAREIDDKWLISIALHFIAIGSSFQGDYELARAQFEESIKIMEEGKGSMQGVAFSNFHLGRISRIHGNFPEAHGYHTEGLQLFVQIGDRRGLGYSFFGFACLAQAQNDPHRAARLFGVLDAIREKSGPLLEAVLQNEYTQVKTTTQELLGEEDFIAAWSEGHAMELEQAIRFALNPK